MRRWLKKEKRRVGSSSLDAFCTFGRNLQALTVENDNTNLAEIENEFGKDTLYMQRGEFVAVPLEFVRHSKHLSVHARWLYVLLWKWVNSKKARDTRVFPSYDTLQEFTGFTRKTVAKALKELEADGWIQKKRRRGTSNLYRVLPSNSWKQLSKKPPDPNGLMS